MVPRYICSAIFLVLLATNVMQGEAMPGYEGVPVYGNGLDFPGDISSNVASAAASAASTAYNGFDNLRTGYGPNIVVPARYRLWNRYGGVLPSLVSGFGGNVVPVAYGTPGLLGGYLGNYGVYGGGASNAASTATASASSVASGNDAVAPGYYGYPGGYYGYPGYYGRVRNYGARGLGNVAAAAAAAAANSAATEGVAKR